MKFITLIFASVFILSAPAIAQEKAPKPLDYSAFKNMPIMHQGRLKPMESFAQIILEQLSGQTQISELNATEWLALALFNPQDAVQIPTFKIENENVLSKFELGEEKPLYSFNDIQPALTKTQSDIEALLTKNVDDLTADEKALVQIHENAATLKLLMRSFSAALPLQITVPHSIREEAGDPTTFMELVKFEQKLEQDLAQIVAAKGQNPENFSPEELAIAKAGFSIQALRAGGENNVFFRVIPSSWEETKLEWFSPWATILQGQGGPETGFLLSQWAELAYGYRIQNARVWNEASKELLEEVKLQSGDVDMTRLNAERTYRASNPYGWVIGFFALAFLAGLIALRKKEK